MSETRNLSQVVLIDSAFARSNTLIPPYREQEEAKPFITLFNLRHSNAGIWITENLYAAWMSKWRILKSAR